MGIQPDNKITIHGFTSFKSDRRIEDRWPASLIVHIIQPSVLSEIKTRNISNNGLFIETDIPFPVGTFIRMEIKLDTARIHVAGYINHMTDGLVPNIRPGAGVRILQMRMQDRILWQNNISQIEKSTRGEIAVEPQIR